MWYSNHLLPTGDKFMDNTQWDKSTWNLANCRSSHFNILLFVRLLFLLSTTQGWVDICSSYHYGVMSLPRSSQQWCNFKWSRKYRMGDLVIHYWVYIRSFNGGNELSMVSYQHSGRKLDRIWYHEYICCSKLGNESGHVYIPVGGANLSP